MHFHMATVTLHNRCFLQHFCRGSCALVPSPAPQTSRMSNWLLRATMAFVLALLGAVAIFDPIRCLFVRVVVLGLMTS